MSVLLLVARLLVATVVALRYLSRNRRILWKLRAGIDARVPICASALPLLGLLFSSAVCGGYDLPPISSRDGKLVAEVSEEDCGAVDSFHSSVNLWQRREGFFAHLFVRRNRYICFWHLQQVA